MLEKTQHPSDLPIKIRQNLFELSIQAILMPQGYPPIPLFSQASSPFIISGIPSHYPTFSKGHLTLQCYMPQLLCQMTHYFYRSALNSSLPPVKTPHPHQQHVAYVPKKILPIRWSIYCFKSQSAFQFVLALCQYSRHQQNHAIFTK